MENKMADLITLDEYKIFASIEGKKTDPQITALIKSCSKIVQDYLGYAPDATGKGRAYVQAHNRTTTYMLPVVNIDVQNTEVYYLPRGNNQVDLVKEDYYISDSGKIDFYTVNPRDGDRFEIVYTLEAQDLESIKLATMLLVKYYYKEEFNKTAMGAGGQTVSYQTGKNFPPQVRAILMMYRMF